MGVLNSARAHTHKYTHRRRSNPIKLHGESDKKEFIKKKNYEVDEERDFDAELSPCSLTGGS